MLTLFKKKRERHKSKVHLHPASTKCKVDWFVLGTTPGGVGGGSHFWLCADGQGLLPAMQSGLWDAEDRGCWGSKKASAAAPPLLCGAPRALSDTSYPQRPSLSFIWWASLKLSVLSPAHCVPSCLLSFLWPPVLTAEAPKLCNFHLWLPWDFLEAHRGSHGPKFRNSTLGLSSLLTYLCALCVFTHTEEYFWQIAISSSGFSYKGLSLSIDLDLSYSLKAAFFVYSTESACIITTLSFLL